MIAGRAWSLWMLGPVAGLLLALSSPGMALDVTLVRPSGMDAVFGVVEVEAQVFLEPGEAVVEVSLWLDGELQGRLSSPPWRWQVDVGDGNREHEFKVLARGSGQEAAARVRTPAIRVDEEVAVELQQLYVTVTDGNRRVLDLEPDNLRVVDNGRPQDLVTFARGDVPLTAVLLMDSSESMRGERLRSALRGARTFIDGMNAHDEAMVMLFADQLVHASPFSQDGDALLRSLDGVEARGNTAINDHLYLSLKLLDARQGRRVVVLFTDGADLHSLLRMEQVLWKARRSQALIYWLQLSEPGSDRSFSTAWRNAEGNRKELDLLKKTVRQSGGKIRSLDGLDQVEPAFRDILDELRQQYVLGYYPEEPRNDGSWRSVNVQIQGRRGLQARTRDGYVDQ